jgi:transposase
MSQKSHCVKLNEQDRLQLEKMVRSGNDKARTITRCRILLLASTGKTDQEISEALSVSLGTIFNIRRRYSQEGLTSALHEKSRSGQPQRFNGKQLAKITAIACSKPPEGRARWSLRLLADHIVTLDIVEEISYQSVRTILKKTNLSLT